jgi:transcriptional regulator with XRE-family HTH domain
MPLKEAEKRNKEIYIEIGRYIHECRTRRKLSLQLLSVRLGVNPSYLREIELGERIPDDEFIRSLAENCQLDENYIYDRLGKSPLIAREELDHHSLLQETLKEIGMSSLSEEKKDEIYQSIHSFVTKELQGE